MRVARTTMQPPCCTELCNGGASCAHVLTVSAYTCTMLAVVLSAQPGSSTMCTAQIRHASGPHDDATPLLHRIVQRWCQLRPCVNCECVYVHYACCRITSAARLIDRVHGADSTCEWPARRCNPLVAPNCATVVPVAPMC